MGLSVSRVIRRANGALLARDETNPGGPGLTSSTGKATGEGRFLLSPNDRPEVRELFGQFQIEVVNTRYIAHA